MGDLDIEKKNIKKRARSVNYSSKETECLVNEVLKRASVIENKRTDAVTWKQKEDAWTDLTETFNAVTASNRTEKMLKVKYDGIKRSIKQKNARQKSEQFKTGGGVAEAVIFEPWEQKLMHLISLSVEGLPTENDCDKEKHIGEYIINSIENSEKQTNTSDEEILEVLVDNLTSFTSTLQKENKDLNWKSWTPTTLRTPINKKLKTSKQLDHVENKFSSLTKSREDLINLQKKVAEEQLTEITLRVELLQKDDARKEFESQLKIKMAIELHNKKMKLLQLKGDKLLK